MLKQVNVARAEAAHRQEILASIEALDAAVAETQWLAQYDSDPNKYKVRAHPPPSFY